MTLDEMYERFPTKESSVAQVERVRWRDGVARCPYCKWTGVSRRGSDGRWHCHRCRNNFTAMVGTVFHGTRVPLQKWFYCIHIILHGNRKIRRMEMGYLLGITHNTALTMMRKIIREIYAGHRNRLEKFCGTEKPCYVPRGYWIEKKRSRRAKKRRKPVIT